MAHKNIIPVGFSTGGSQHNLKNVSVVCDRCHKTVQGLESSMGTAGFYHMTGYWGLYRESPDEKIVCDECMSRNGKYRHDFGFTNVAL